MWISLFMQIPNQKSGEDKGQGKREREKGH